VKRITKIDRMCGVSEIGRGFNVTNASQSIEIKSYFIEVVFNSVHGKFKTHEMKKSFVQTKREWSRKSYREREREREREKEELRKTNEEAFKERLKR
jgi:hypothetical protein